MLAELLIRSILIEFPTCNVMPTNLVIDGSIDNGLTLWRIARDGQASTATMASRDLDKISEANEVLVTKQGQLGQVARFGVVSDGSTDHRTVKRIRIEK